MTLNEFFSIITKDKYIEPYIVALISRRAVIRAINFVITRVRESEDGS